MIDAVKDPNLLYLFITILHNKENETIKAKTLLDSGAGGIFIDQNFVQKHKLRQMELKQPIKAQNVDGTENKQGTICFHTDLNIKISDKTFQKRFYITGLGNQKVILGFPWLRTHNLEIDWKKGTVTWRNLEQSKNFDKEMATKKGVYQKGTTTDYGRRRGSGINKEPFFEPPMDMDTILLEFLNMEDKVWINTKTNMATSLVAASI